MRRHCWVFQIVLELWALQVTVIQFHYIQEAADRSKTWQLYLHCAMVTPQSSSQLYAFMELCCAGSVFHTDFFILFILLIETFIVANKCNDANFISTDDTPCQTD